MSLVTGEKWRFFLQNVNCFQWMDIPHTRTHYLNFKPSKQLDETNLELVSPMITFPVNYNHAVM